VFFRLHDVAIFLALIKEIEAINKLLSSSLELERIWIPTFSHGQKC